MTIQMCCPKCNRFQNGQYCSNCGSKLISYSAHMEVNSPYDKMYGLWEVTTEGDEEGRSTRSLGFYKGWVDDIAKALAPNCFYTLRFNAITPKKLPPVLPTTKEAVITLSIDSGTWEKTAKNRVAQISPLFKNRLVRVVESNNYAAVKLIWDD